MRPTSLSLGLSPLLVAGCAAVNDALNTAVAAAIPLLAEGFEAPLTNNYTVFRQGQALATASNVWQVSAASVDRRTARARPREIRGKLVGDTITGEWYSQHAKQGWNRYVARMLPDGSIDPSQSDAPIRSPMKTAVLTRKP